MPLASLEEMAIEVLEAPRRRHQRQPANTSELKARVQIARPATVETALVTLETASDPHEAPAC